jgi:hypothetical protein
LRLGFKHRSPVAERLQRNALRFAILPLVQVDSDNEVSPQIAEEKSQPSSSKE